MAKSKRLKPSFRKSNSVLNKRTFKNSQNQKSRLNSSIPPTKHNVKQKPPTKASSTPSNKQKADIDSGNLQTTIPFSVYDRILLVGEGNFSFSSSLVTHHGVADIWATTYDSQEDCYEKYPRSAKENIALILDAFEEGDETAIGKTETKPNKAKSRVLFNIDATSLNKLKVLRSIAPFHRIIFNFPHVGGISTDVNRQVRANQKLLSEFFHACLPLLSATSSPKHGEYQDEESQKQGSVIVTLFEGEPYTLWNPRDLARHAGFQVWRSWRFDAGAFPGYKHVRTAGTIVDKTTGDVSETAWKGEDRLARVYEFGVGPAPWDHTAGLKNKKRKGGDSDSSDND